MYWKLAKVRFDHFLILAIFIFFLVVIASHLRQPLFYWTYGDWLINYSGGFVRRGLAGEIFLFFANASGIPLDSVVNYSILLLALMLILLLFVIAFWLNSLQVFWLCFGPCLLFPTFWDSGYFGRRDLLVLLLIALHTSIVTYGWHVRNFQTYILPVLLAIGTLVHEIQFYFLPFHLFLITIQEGNLRRPLIINSVATVTVFLLVMLHSGSLNQAVKICESIKTEVSGEAYQRYCNWPQGVKGIEGGPIYNIGASKLGEYVDDQVHWLFSRSVAFQAYAVLYFICVGLTLILFRGTLNEVRTHNLTGLFELANLMFIANLFMGIDVGRWIVLTCFHNFLVLSGASVYYRTRESSPFWMIAIVVLTAVFVRVDHTAGHVHSLADIFKSQLGDAWAAGLLHIAAFVKTFTY